MSKAPQAKPALHARVDGRRVLFEVEEAGATFAAAQEQIEAVARRKLAGRSAATGGLMNLFSDDFEEEEAPAE